MVAAAPVAVDTVPAVTTVSNFYLGAGAPVAIIGVVPEPPRITWTVPVNGIHGTYTDVGGSPTGGAPRVEINAEQIGYSSLPGGIMTVASDAVTGGETT